jgi:hypothetical protein
MYFLRRKQKISTDQLPPTKTKSRKSTLKQEKFVEGVVRHGNASRAAREAGYSPRSAAVIGSRNLKRPGIQERIKSRIDDAKVETDEIVGTLVSDICDLLGDDGRLDLARAIENGSSHIIKKLVIRTRSFAGPMGKTGRSLTVREGVAPDPANTSTEDEVCQYPIEETTYEIVLHDSQSAARHLARILHLEVKNRPPEARRPTDDELAHRMADLLERARANGRREGAAGIQRPPQTMESHSEYVLLSSLEPDMPPASPGARAEVEYSRWPLQNGHKKLGMPPSLAAARMRAESRVSTLENLPAHSSEPQVREGLFKNPARNGLWNRLFNSDQVLTFLLTRLACLREAEEH